MNRSAAVLASASITIFTSWSALEIIKLDRSFALFFVHLGLWVAGQMMILMLGPRVARNQDHAAKPTVAESAPPVGDSPLTPLFRRT